MFGAKRSKPFREFPEQSRSKHTRRVRRYRRIGKSSSTAPSAGAAICMLEDLLPPASKPATTDTESSAGVAPPCRSKPATAKPPTRCIRTGGCSASQSNTKSECSGKRLAAAEGDASLPSSSVIYTASSTSLAMLEMLMHLQSRDLLLFASSFACAATSSANRAFQSAKARAASAAHNHPCCLPTERRARALTRARFPHRLDWTGSHVVLDVCQFGVSVCWNYDGRSGCLIAAATPLRRN